jgi:transcriptional regulator with XRE-family HTH domain
MTWLPCRGANGQKILLLSGIQAILSAVRAARNKAGLTQEDVAKRLNRPQSYVSKYESGERRLDLIEFLRVTKTLKVDPDTILKMLV